MLFPPKGRVLVVDDGSADATALVQRVVARFPGSPILRSGTDVEGDVETILVRDSDVSVDRGMLEAAERGIVWVAVPKSLSSGRNLMREAALASTEVEDEEVPGFVLISASDVDPVRPYKRVALVYDNEDQTNSGMIVLATVGFAIRAEAEVDVLLLGVDPSAGTTGDELAKHFQLDRARDIARQSMRYARERGITVDWHPVGTPRDKAEAVHDFVLLRDYDLVITGIGDLRLGMKGRRARNLEKALDDEKGGRLALSILETAPCDVALVVDGVSTGVITPGMIRGGAVAGLALGSVFTGGVLTQTAMAAESGGAAATAAADTSKKGSAESSSDASNLTLVTEAEVVTDAGYNTADFAQGLEQKQAQEKAEKQAAKGPLTGAELEQIAPSTPDDLADEYAMRINLAMDHYNIDTPQQQAMFVAQIAHETDGFQTLEEYASGADYEGRSDLGNTQPGDGEKYKGRGAIQLTGRANYEAASEEFGVDFVENPELAASPEYAFEIAGWFWESHGLNEVADSGDFVQVTQTINGGMNGYDDRVNYYEASSAVLN